VIKYFLKEGDLVISGKKTFLLVKQTKNFWYYYCTGHCGRVRKEKLWKIEDLPDSNIIVKYGTPLRGRKIRINT